MKSSEVFNFLHELSLQPGMVFRGISNDDEMAPKIQRVWNQEKQSLENLSVYEFEMLDIFFRKGSSLISFSNDALVLITLAQHYGVPTRFIDWSFDPFTALFFSTYRESDTRKANYKIIYTNIFSHSRIEQYLFRTFFDGPIVEPLQSYEALIKEIMNDEGLTSILTSQSNVYEKFGLKTQPQNPHSELLFYIPSNSNQRIIAQRGVFSIPRKLNYRLTTTEDVKVIDLELNEVELDNIRLRLEEMNYSLYRLFPDLASLGAYVEKIAVNQINRNKPGKKVPPIGTREFRI